MRRPGIVVLISIACLAACQSAPADIAATANVDAIPVPQLADSVFPATPFGIAARRGWAIVTATRESLPEYALNALRCTSCHLDEGRRPFAMSWVGVHARYPQYRSRSATIQTLEDRINDCFERSLGGKPLPAGDARLRAIEAYMAWLSPDAAFGAKTRGQGIDSVHVTTPDTSNGANVFRTTCARCHGEDGGGNQTYPPVWGERSYSIGAGMGRYVTAAGFIRHNMPYDQPGRLTEQEALDVAAYIDSRPRRDFQGKERDWPNGNAPPDVPYRTVAKRD